MVKWTTELERRVGEVRESYARDTIAPTETAEQHDARTRSMSSAALEGWALCALGVVKVDE